MSSFRKLSVFSLIATLVLVSIGGLVRATKSGLGCGTDWPDCGGRLIPALATRAEIIEFSHRAAASVVVVLLGLLAVQAYRRRREFPSLLWPSVGAFGLVMFQAVLGAVVVKLELEAESVILHLGTALSLVALLIYIVALSAATENDLAEPEDAAVNKSSRMVAGAVFLLLLVGSYVSGKGAGLAFPDWPLMGGKVIPSLVAEEQQVHFFHRALAAVVGVIVVMTMVKITRRKSEQPLASKLAHAGAGLFAVEVLIGAANVWTDLNAAAVSAHLAIGALIWASWVGAAVVSSPKLHARALAGPTEIRRAAGAEAR